MAEVIKIYPSWVNVYAGRTLYKDQSKIIAGGRISEGSTSTFNTWFGLSPELITLLRSSKIPATLNLFIRAEIGSLEVQVFPHNVLINPGDTRPDYPGTMLKYFSITDHPTTFPKWLNLGNSRLNVVDKIISGEIQGFALDGTTDDRLTALNTGEFKPYFELTGDWNEPPTAPKITHPNGGELLYGPSNITWLPSADNESPVNSLTYQVQLSRDNGRTWNTLNTRTEPGATSITYDFSSGSETSLARIRVRAYDDIEYGEWGESDGVFTIQHNVAPLAPTQLTPKGFAIDRTKTTRLAWQHNDPNPNDAQSKADLHWRQQGAQTWNTLTSNGEDQEYFIGPNVFQSGKVEWQVRTYDQQGLVSPYSNLAVFTAADPTNIPTILQPPAIVPVSRPVIEWSSVSQSSYQLIIEDSLGAIVWDTGDVTSTIKTRTSGVDLINGATYTIKVRIKDGTGLFSSFASKSVTISYTPPEKPIVTAYPADGYIAFNIEAPTPTGSRPSVINHEVYKRIDNVWTRIAYGVGSAFNDYHVKSGQTYEYYVKAMGDNGTTSSSDLVTQSSTFRGSWIHTIQDAEASLQYFRYNGTGYETGFEPESAVMKFAGRTRPVVHFGAYEEYALTVMIQEVEGMGDMEALRTFVRNRETICYRDTDGNLIVGHLLALNISKEYRVSSATITIVETDFTEGV